MQHCGCTSELSHVVHSQHLTFDEHDTVPVLQAATAQQSLQAKEAAAMESLRAGVLSPGTRPQRTVTSPLSPVSSPPRRGEITPRGQPGGGESAGLRMRPRAAAQPRASGRVLRIGVLQGGRVLPAVRLLLLMQNLKTQYP